MPDLSRTDDDIANGTWRTGGREPAPLALFTAERVDYSLQRLYHYTGTHPEYFQRFVLLTNYQRYVEHFVAFAREAGRRGRRVRPVRRARRRGRASTRACATSRARPAAEAACRRCRPTT